MKVLKIRIIFLLLFLTSYCLTAQSLLNKTADRSLISPDKTVEKLNTSISQNIQRKEYRYAAEDLLSVAKAYKLQGNFDEALFKLFYAREVIAIHLQDDQASDLLMGNCLETIGEIFYYRFMEKESIGFYQDAFRYYSRISDFPGMAGVLNLMVESEISMGDTLLAKQHVIILSLMSKTTSDKIVKAQYFSARASLYSAGRQFEAAVASYEKSLKLFQESEDVLNASKTYGLIAESYIEKEDYNSAMQWSDTGIAYNSKWKNTGGFFEMVYYKAFTTGFIDREASIRIAENALDSIAKTKFSFHEGVFCSMLVDAYTGHNDGRALYYMTRYLEVYKKVYGMVSEQRIAEMTLKVFTDRLNSHIANLKIQQDLNDKIRLGQRNMIFYFVIALIILLLISIGNLKKMQFRLFLFREYMLEIMPLPAFFLAFEVYFFMLLNLLNNAFINQISGLQLYVHIAALATIPSIIITLALLKLPAIWSVSPEKNKSYSTVAFFTIGLLNCLVLSYYLAFGIIGWQVFDMLNIVFTYTGLTVVPLFFMVIYIEKVLLRKHIHEAGLMNTKIRKSVKQGKPSTQTIRIESDKSKDVFESAISDLLLVEGQSNYTKFYFMEKGSLKSMLLLMTLKQAESQLQSYKEFIRCHKSNIVNISRVSKVNGNSHGYKLSVPPMEEFVTVSKSYISEFNEAFNRFSADNAPLVDQ